MVIAGAILLFSLKSMKDVEFVGSSIKPSSSSIWVVSSVGLITPLVSLKMSW